MKNVKLFEEFIKSEINDNPIKEGIFDWLKGEHGVVDMTKPYVNPSEKKGKKKEEPKSKYFYSDDDEEEEEEEEEVEIEEEEEDIPFEVEEEEEDTEKDVYEEAPSEHPNHKEIFRKGCDYLIQIDEYDNIVDAVLWMEKNKDVIFKYIDNGYRVKDAINYVLFDDGVR